LSGGRADRVADRIREELARLLREEVRDPRIGFVTLTGVDLSPDLRHARVYVTILGQDREQALAALAGATPFLRRALARSAGLRFTPRLDFKHDASLDAGLRVDRILDELSHEQDTEGPDDDASGDEPET
jgi:ribosome-binding factor A